jgi:hypothetical protein
VLDDRGSPYNCRFGCEYYDKERWAIGSSVKHAKLDISDLIALSISVFYSNHGGDQTFNVKSLGIVSFQTRDTKAWLLPVLNGMRMIIRCALAVATS